MAQSYFTMTGVLKLGKATPVIKALFGVFELDEHCPGNGQAYIAKIAEESSTRWDSIMESLQELAASLEIQLEEDADYEDVLRALAQHFNATDNEVLKRIIENADFDDEADLDSVFEIAKAFDDGHGLTAYKTEAAWYCSRPRLFEFGGSGDFVGAHIAVSGSSSTISATGENIESALAAGDTDKAADIIFRENVAAILDGIYNEGVRDAVRAKLSVLLA